MLHSRFTSHAACAASILLGLSSLTGCADLLLVEIGEAHVEPFELDRSYELVGEAIAECPVGEHELVPGHEARAASVVFTPRADGCVVDIRIEGAVLMTAVETAQRAVQLEEQGDVGAVRALDLEVRELTVDDGAGRPLDLGGVDALSVSIDDQEVLSREDVESIRAGERPRITLPQSFLDRFIDALREREAMKADLRLTLVLGDPAATIPSRLRLYALLQPILLVDVLDAKL